MVELKHSRSESEVLRGNCPPLEKKKGTSTFTSNKYRLSSSAFAKVRTLTLSKPVSKKADGMETPRRTTVCMCGENYFFVFHILTFDRFR